MRTPTAALAILMLAATTARAGGDMDRAADRAEAAATRSEAAAGRAEAGAKRVEDAVERLERAIERMAEQDSHRKPVSPQHQPAR